MISRFELIPTTRASHPYARADIKCRFAERAFVEEEYFLHGTANVYATVNGTPEVVYADAPYVNRLLLRRPESPKRFSGRVVVEILNSTSWMDIDRIWVHAREKFMRDGDIYVGITSKPNTIPVMRKLDPKRYAPLNWANPRPCTRRPEELGNMPGASSPETEDGLFWDMLRELPDALKFREDSPLRDFGKFKIYLAGWSQSGAYLTRFVNSFAYLDPSRIADPVYDGYYSAGAASMIIPGLNQEETSYPAAFNKDVPWMLGKVYQPFIELHTETENVNLGNLACRREDSDAEDFLYRAYDIPGVSHDNKDCMVDYYYMDADAFITGMVLGYGGREHHPTDYPYNFIFHRAWNILFDWAEKGEKPMHVPRIPFDPYTQINHRDEDGNAVGGWRTAFLELPTCTYYTASTPLKPDLAFGCTMFGFKEPFSAEELKKRYGSLENYHRLVSVMAREQVADGLLEEEDVTAYVALALKNARDGGLE